MIKTKHIALLTLGMALSGCGGGSGGGSDAGTATNQIPLNPFNDPVDDDFEFEGASDLVISDLDSLPPFSQRIYGGADFGTPVSGPVMAYDYIPNADLIKEIPFTNERGDRPRELVYEAVYVISDYSSSPLGFQLDQPEPMGVVVITNVSNKTVCGVSGLIGYGETSSGDPIVLSEIAVHGYTAAEMGVSDPLTRIYNSNCIPSGMSIYATGPFSKGLDDNDDRVESADLDDIASLEMSSIEFSGDGDFEEIEEFELISGIVVNAYEATDSDNSFALNVVNQSSRSFEIRGLATLVLDPETMIPVYRSNHNQRLFGFDRTIAAGEEQTEYSFSTRRFVGSSSMILVVPSFDENSDRF